MTIDTSNFPIFCMSDVCTGDDEMLQFIGMIVLLSVLLYLTYLFFWPIMAIGGIIIGVTIIGLLFTILQTK